MKKLLSLILAVVLTLGLAACGTGVNDADVVSKNISTAADNFEVQRRIVFYNGITGEYILTIEGPCSLGNFDSRDRLSVTCKTGANSYKKHFLGISDNVTYFVEQGEPVEASAYHYRVVFKPQTIIPDVDFKGSAEAEELPQSQTDDSQLNDE